MSNNGSNGAVCGSNPPADDQQIPAPVRRYARRRVPPGGLGLPIQRPWRPPTPRPQGTDVTESQRQASEYQAAALTYQLERMAMNDPRVGDTRNILGVYVRDGAGARYIDLTASPGRTTNGLPNFGHGQSGQGGSPRWPRTQVVQETEPEIPAELCFRHLRTPPTDLIFGRPGPVHHTRPWRALLPSSRLMESSSASSRVAGHQTAQEISEEARDRAENARELRSLLLNYAIIRAR